MPINILMPALSPTMTEGNLAKWLVKEGDAVSAGDVIAEIETDKATMEVEAVDEGTVGKLMVDEGAEGVPVNQVIGVLLEEGEDAASIGDATSAPPPPAPAAEATPAPSAPAAPATPANGAPADVTVSPLAKRVAEQMGVDLSTVAGTGPDGKITLGDVKAAAGGASAPSAPSAAPAAASSSGGRVFASPLARRMATDANIDLSAVSGSGPHGRIVKADIEAAIAGGTATAAAAQPQEVAAPAPARPAASAEDGPAFEDVKLSTMRKVIADRMTESKTQVPHFYLTMDCEIDELLKIRSELNKKADPDKVSVNDFVIRACALALRDVPAANTSYLGDGMMRQHNTVDISVAVAIEGGLITPIVFDADKKGLVQISRETKDLAARARDGKLMPEEYQGGSFSLSNLGMFGVKAFDAVINPPQACILAVGAGEQRPVVKDGEIVPATVMSCTLSVDHRVVDGAIGAELLAAIKRYIDYPPLMLM